MTIKTCKHCGMSGNHACPVTVAQLHEAARPAESPSLDPLGSGTEDELRMEYATKRYLRAHGMHIQAEECDELTRLERAMSDRELAATDKLTGAGESEAAE